MPLAQGQRVVCIDTANGAEHLSQAVHYIIEHIRETGGVRLLNYDFTYYRASRFKPYHHFIYLRGTHYDPELSAPVLPEFSPPSRLDEVDSTPVRVSPRGLYMDSQSDGLSARASQAWARASDTVNSAFARPGEVHYVTDSIDRPVYDSFTWAPPTETLVQEPRRPIVPPSEQRAAQARTRLDHLRGYRGASSNRPPRG